MATRRQRKRVFEFRYVGESVEKLARKNSADGWMDGRSVEEKK